MYDIIIIGGGPAGLTAALYGLRAGKSVLVIEKHGFGGQIAYSPKVENIPGTISISGAEFADKLTEQAMNLGADVELENVVSVEPSMTAAVLPMRESTPYSAIKSAPTARAALPLMGRTSTSIAVSGGIPKKRNTGANTALMISMAPEARSIVTAVSSRISAGRILTSSFSPSSAPCSMML